MLTKKNKNVSKCCFNINFELKETKLFSFDGLNSLYLTCRIFLSNSCLEVNISYSEIEKNGCKIH